jgi:uncharacterized protein
MGRAVVHWELMSREPAKIASFYERTFGWKVQHLPEMNYHLVDTGGNGGILKPQAQRTLARQHDLLHRCRRPRAYRQRMVAEGGQIQVEEQEVPGMAAFTLFTDPEGRMMGLWKTAKK